MKSRIVIVMDGGIIQAILANSPEVEIAVIDYDVESVDEERLVDIPQTEQILGAKEKAFAYVADQADEINPARVEQLFAAITDPKTGVHVGASA